MLENVLSYTKPLKYQRPKMPVDGSSSSFYFNFKGVGNATSCVVNDRIYVTGGHYGYRGTCTYEKIQTYRPDINEWSITTICPHPGEPPTFCIK